MNSLLGLQGVHAGKYNPQMSYVPTEIHTTVRVVSRHAVLEQAEFVTGLPRIVMAKGIGLALCRDNTDRPTAYGRCFLAVVAKGYAYRGNAVQRDYF